MKHADDGTLDRVEVLLAELRTLAGLKEKKRGVFYRKSRAFLHFHADGPDVYADVRLTGPGFERFRVSSGAERKRLLAAIRAQLLVVAALCLALVATPARADDARLWGTFVNPAQNEAAIDAAIERVVAKMTFFTRPFARAEVKAASPTFRRLTLEKSSDTITASYDVGQPVRTPADGSPGRWTRDDGDVYEVKASFVDGHLHQSFQNKGGGRLNVFTLSPDGRTLTIDVMLTSDRLPEPIRYQLVFERATP